MLSNRRPSDWFRNKIRSDINTNSAELRLFAMTTQRDANAKPKRTHDTDGNKFFSMEDSEVDGDDIVE